MSLVSTRNLTHVLAQTIQVSSFDTTQPATITHDLERGTVHVSAPGGAYVHPPVHRGRPNQNWPGWNLARIAKECGVSPQHTCDVLNGKKGASAEVWRRLASALGIGMEKLMARVDEIRKANSESTVSESPASESSKGEL